MPASGTRSGVFPEVCGAGVGQAWGRCGAGVGQG